MGCKINITKLLQRILNGKIKNYIQKLHKSSKRNYKRMLNSKVYCMKIAKKYGKQYWDGNRKFGYGGYRYILVDGKV